MNVVFILRIIGYVLTAAGSGVGIIATHKQNQKEIESDAKAREDFNRRITKLENERKEKES